MANNNHLIVKLLIMEFRYFQKYNSLLIKQK